MGDRQVITVEARARGPPGSAEGWADRNDATCVLLQDPSQIARRAHGARDVRADPVSG